MSDLGGINPNHAVAGFGGGLAYLPFMKPDGRSILLAALGCLAAGVVTAAYVTPMVADVLAGPKFLGASLTPRSENGLAFLLGLTAMVFIPFVLSFVRWMGSNVNRLGERVFCITPKTPTEAPTDTEKSVFGLAPPTDKKEGE